MNLRHDYPVELCPITGQTIPNGYSWTDHAKQGCYNSCLSCCPDFEHKSIGSALHALQASREKDNE